MTQFTVRPPLFGLFIGFLLGGLTFSSCTPKKPPQPSKSSYIEWFRARGEKNVILITGSSSGIGYAMANIAVRLNMRLALVDINPKGSLELIQRTRKENILFIEADLRRPQKREYVISKVLQRFGRIDFLINNAGYGYMSPIEEIDVNEAQANMDVNFWAPLHLAQLVIPTMKKQGGGQIINIGSIAAHIPELMEGDVSIYIASKSALLGWSKILRREMSPHGIQVKIVSPAGTKTNYFKNLKGSGAKRLQDIMNKKWDVFDTPEQVASETFRGMTTDEFAVFPGLAGRVMTELKEKGRWPKNAY